MIRFFALVVSIILTSASALYAAPQHGITLFGDLKYQANYQHFDYVNPNAPKGGTIKMAYTAAFDNLNPFILKGVSAPGMSMVFESLMSGSLDEPQSYYGVLAESIELADDKTYADFILRKEAHWHDGKPVTADDVIFSLETFKTKAHPAYRIIYKPITKVEKLSERIVRFHFDDPKNRELPIIAAGMSVLPKHYYEHVEFDKTTLTPPLGSGPYKIGKVDQGRSITFERMKDYWGSNMPFARGMYNFDEIRYDTYRDETVAVEAIKSGQYDFREEYIARNWATAYATPKIDSGELVKRKIPHKIPRGMQAFLFNTRQGKFSDPNVRRAIGLTMDYEWMNETLFYGAYDRSHSFFQSTDFMADGLPSEGEIKLLEPFKNDLPPELFIETFKIPTTDGSGHARENLLTAQNLLNMSGWVMKEGVRVNEKTGEPLTVEFMMRQRTFERVVGSMIRNLKRLGIEATFRYVDDSQYQKRIDDRDFDIISIWWNRGIFFPGNEQISFWHSSQADVVGGNNYSGVQRPVIDHLLDTLTSAQTLEELTPAAMALDRVLLWGHYVIPHWHMAAWRVLYWNRFGRPDVEPSYGLGIESWWDKELEESAQ